MKQPDPMWRLFEYACDKFYYIDCSINYEPAIIKGLLINYNGPRFTVLTEHGVCVINYKDINFMRPISIPKDLSDDFKEVVESYLKERAEFNETLS